MKPAPPLVILNASILTMDPLHPRAEALYCREGRIVAVGSNADIRALAEPDAVVLSAEGATVTPGFSENHMHLFSGAAELDHLQLAGVSGFQELAARARMPTRQADPSSLSCLPRARITRCSVLTSA